MNQVGQQKLSVVLLSLFFFRIDLRMEEVR